MPPSPAFSMPLQRIEHWVPASQEEEEVQALDFTCGECPQHFVNADLLLRHYRKEHSVPGFQRDGQVLPVSPQQESVDNDHWNAPERKPWACDRDSCEYRARSKKYLLRHQRYFHDKIRPFACDFERCSFTSSILHQLQVHHATVHLGERTYICPYPECGGRGFGQESTRDNHVTTMHNSPVACGKCNLVVANSRELVDHKNREHAGPKQKYVCSVPGCGFRTARPASMEVYMESHSSEKNWPCTIDGCNKAYKNKGSRDRHMKKSH